VTLPASAAESAWHESHHLSASFALGHVPHGLYRNRDGSGATIVRYPVERVKDGIAVAAIIMMPFIGACTGVGKDLRKLAALERHGVDICAARVLAAEIITDERFDEVKWIAFDESMKDADIDEDGVRSMLAPVNRLRGWALS